MSAIRVDRRRWILDGVAALVMLIAGTVEALVSVHYNVFPNRGTLVPVVVATAVAVGLARRWPGVAVALVWLIFGFQTVTGAPTLVVQTASAVVVFGTARWGGTATMVAGALAVPVAGVLAGVGSGAYAAFLVAALFGVCWLAGLALRRLSDRAAHSLASQRAAEEDAARAHRESEQAKEIARLREEQAQLARDVHDVVGHSLAVILAQAESAQFIDDADSAAVRRSMADIAKLARASLRDVRQVLASSTPSETGPGELHDLVEGIRASGHELTFQEIGTARTLAPELATVAYRVLQEMLTNAIRHGTRTIPVAVDLRWADELRIETANAIAPENPTDSGHDGRGLDGMRRRLESVGGRLDVQRRHPEKAGCTDIFTVTAWVPVRRLAP
ncbi:sensor histidine kinase [Nocardia transvalensis]|uniref:sensor histidine kinase n=1 Tax=Nocardia transvalensis TaxID=37333 RepID=UPI0018939C83|nr:histidine kinase [Nocardia transvalensis]MBF6333114.1 hypothetical protein [Nocardia transvalensis]